MICFDIREIKLQTHGLSQSFSLQSQHPLHLIHAANQHSTFFFPMSPQNQRQVMARKGATICEGECFVWKITTWRKWHIHSKSSISEHLTAASYAGTVSRTLFCNRQRQLVSRKNLAAVGRKKLYFQMKQAGVWYYVELPRMKFSCLSWLSRPGVGMEKRLEASCWWKRNLRIKSQISNR